jgi:putative cardiolipin synthase
MNVMDRVMQSRTEAVISSPYFIPGEAGVKALGDLRRRNVDVSVLTNSLAANDVPLVHAGYARYRVALLRADVALYELSPSQRDPEDRPMLPGVSLGRLHAKTAVIDRRIVYIGSMNLDPRSETGNTELGILVDCPELASHVIRVLEMNKQLGAYRVRLASDGHGLEWTAQDGPRQTVVFHEPEATPFLLLRSMLFAPFVPEQLL